jgi:poly(hydroxyalkanoate) depolymerase family esterase
VIPGTFTALAGSRDYLLYLPPGDAPPTGRPLVVMLHGCTQSPADFAAGTAMNRLADSHGFVVLYPAQSKAANQSACWNWFNPRDQQAGGGEPSIIAGMVRDVAERHGIDRGRINVAGLSAGGAMAAILAEAYPDLFSAVAVHSGLPSGAAHDLPSALSAMKRGSASPVGATGEPAGGFRSRRAGKPVRTIVFHGRQDKTVHPGNGRQVVEAALSGWPADALVAKREEGRSAGGRSFIRTIHADAAGKPMVEQWEVQGAGHAWFGGSASGSYTDPKSPDASAAMVAFFQIG